MLEGDIEERLIKVAPSQNPRDPVGVTSVQAEMARQFAADDMESQVDPTTPPPAGVTGPQVRLAQQFAAEDKLAVSASLLSATQVTPEQAARAKRLGQQSGVGMDVALRNMQSLERKAFIRGIDSMDLPKTDPTLAEFLANPDNAKIAQNDIDNLRAEKGFFDELSGYLPDVGEIGVAYQSGKDARDAMRFAGRLRRMETEPSEQDMRRARDMRDVSAGMYERGGGGGIPGAFYRFAGQQVENLYQAAGRGATTGLLFGLGALAAGEESTWTVPVAMGVGFKAGFVATMAEGTFEELSGEAYLDMRDMGIDHRTAQVASGAAGVLTSALELLGFRVASSPAVAPATRAFNKYVAREVAREVSEKAIADTLPVAARQALKEYVVGGGGEIATEVVEVGVNSVAASFAQFYENWGLSEEDKKHKVKLMTAEGWRQMMAQGTEAFFESLKAMVIPAAIGPGGSFAARASSIRRAKQASATINRAMEMTRKSQLRALDPTAHEQLLEQRAAGTPLQDVYIDAQAMDVIMRQQGITMDDMDSIIPDFSKRMADAAASNASIRMGGAEFLSRLSETEVGRAMAKQLRVGDPRADSMFDVAAFEAGRQQMVDNYRAIQEGRTKAEKEFVDSANRVEDDITAMLKATGTMSPEQLEANAELHTSFVVMAANRLKMMPYAFWSQWRNEIVGPQAQMAQPAALEQRLVDDFGRATQAQRWQWQKAQTGQPTTVTAWHAPAGSEAAQVTQEARERMGRSTTLGDGWYGARDKDVAETYGTPEAFEVTLSNPFVIETSSSRDVLRITNEELQAIRDAGHDGIIMRGTTPHFAGQDRSHQQVVAFNPEQSVKPVTQATPLAQQQVAQMDADYMAAVERGDTKTAQRMVDEAAQQAMPQSVVRGDGDIGVIGKLLRVFHGSGAFIRQFMYEFTSQGVDQLGSGFYFTTDRPEAVSYTTRRRDAETPKVGGEQQPTVVEAYLDIRNPLGAEQNGSISREQVRRFIAAAPQESRREGLENWGIDGDTPNAKVLDAYAFEDANILRELFKIANDFYGTNTEAFNRAIRDILGYDGVVQDFRVDGVSKKHFVAFFPEQIKSAEPITRDEAGNVVPLSRRFNLQSRKVYEQTPVGPRMMAVHNLSAENLQFADEMGGLAVPSIGVITEERGGVENFGEITLIGTRELADPERSRVFSSDAYSARFPKSEWPAVPTKKAQAVVDSIRDAAVEFEDESVIQNTWDSMVNDPNADRLASQWMRSPAAIATFLRERGVEVAPIMQARKTMTGLEWSRIERLRPLWDAVNWNLDIAALESSPEYIALAEAYANEWRDQYSQVAFAMRSDTMAGVATFDATAYSRLRRDMQVTDAVTVNRIDTREMMIERVEPMAAEYKAWVDAKVRSQFGASFLRVGKRKVPYTLGNIVAVMSTRDVRLQEKSMTFGRGAARAAQAVEFKDIEQMREAAKTAIADPKEYGKAAKASEKLLEAYRNAVIEFTTIMNYRGVPDTWEALDASMRAIAEYGKRKRRSPDAMRKALRKERFDVAKIPDDVIEQAIDAANALYTAPVPYFEAKPQRAVGLGEFAGAVIPWNATPETRAILERNNVPFIEYAPGDDAARQAAVREMAATQSEKAATLFQGEPGVPGEPQGTFDPETNTTRLTNSANFSTFAHESSHYYLEVIGRIAARADAPPEIAGDMATILGWFGIEGATPADKVAKWNSMSLEEKRPHHEAWARNFEIYLFEGKAPSVELQPVFERFKRWFKRLYKSIREQLNEQYRAQFGKDLPAMTGEVRQVMDRLFASDEQIARAESIRSMEPDFQTQEQSGMSDSEWAAYQELSRQATDDAAREHAKASLRQMQWLSGAKSRMLKEMQDKHDEMRAAIRKEVTRTVRMERVYRAIDFLRRGKWIDEAGNEQFNALHRIDLDAVKRMYALEPESLRPDFAKLGYGKNGMLASEGGVDPEIVAERLGYDSADQMIRDILGADPISEVIDARTDERMLAEGGELATPESREEAVDAALHNEARGRFIAVEYRFHAKATQPVQAMLKAARNVARQIIAGRRIRDIRPREYVAAETRAARDAATALRNFPDPVAIGDAAYSKALSAQESAIAAGMPMSEAQAIAEDARREAASKAQERVDAYRQKYPEADAGKIVIAAKRNQLLNNQLAAEALAVREEVRKAVKYAREVLRDSNRQRMGADAADQIEVILERFDMRQVSVEVAARRRSLADWVKSQEEIGLEPDVPEIIASEAFRIPYQDMTVEQFRDVVDMVRQIEHMGRNKNKALAAARQKKFDEARDEIVETINREGAIRGRAVKPETARTTSGKAMQRVGRFMASHLKSAIIVQILEGGKEGGPLWSYLIRTANEAGDRETAMRAKATEDVSRILAPLFKGERMGGKGRYFPSIKMTLNRESRIAIALNWGNDGNRQRLLDGAGWTGEQVMPVLESLTAQEFDIVQQVWNYFEQYRPMIAEKDRRHYGKEPNWVEPIPFEIRTADGSIASLQGGYYPIKYDPLASMRAESFAEADEARQMMRGANISATTRASFRKARADEVVGRPLLYDLSGLYSGINEVIHDLSWHDWVIDANRLMRDEQFDAAVRTRLGPEYKRQLRNWIRDVAADGSTMNHDGEIALNFLRQNISAAGLGFNLVSAVGQVIGFNQSIVKVGYRHMGRSIAQFIANPLRMTREVRNATPMMVDRGRTQFRELNELRNRVQGETVAARRLKLGVYFLMMRMQALVDIPTWAGAYEKAIEAGNDEATAKALADQAVIDSQGSGMVKDLAAIQRGGAAMKLFTVFYNYMSTVYNMAALKTMTERSKAKLAHDYLMIFVVPSVLMSLLKSALRPDEEPEELDPEALARTLAAESLEYTMGSMVIARELAGAAKIVTGAPGAGRDYAGPAGLRTIADLYQFSKQAAQGEFDKSFRRSSINLLGDLFGIPSAQINRTIEGIENATEGELEGPAANIRAILFGVEK